MSSLRRTLAWTLLPAILLSGAAAAAPRQEGQEPQRVELLVQAGRAFKDRRYGEAVQLYRSAWAIDPDDGQPLVMAGVAAFETGDAELARRDLEQSLQRRLSPEDRDLARTYLDLMSQDLQAPPAAGSLAADAPTLPVWTPSVATSMGGGYDSDARQVAARGLDGAAAGDAVEAGSLFAAAGVQLAIARPLGQAADIELRYGVEQRIHADRTLTDLDFLDHEAAVELSHRLGKVARLGLSVAGDLSFSGIATAARPFQRALRVDPQIAVGHGAARLRLGVGWQAVSTLDPALTFLSGQRLEVAATPTVTVAGWQISLAGRLRQEILGTDRSDPTADDRSCPGCLQTEVVPYSNRSVGATFRLAAPLRWRLRPGLTGRWEGRVYDRPQRTEVRSRTLEQRSVHLRHDRRLALGASLALRLRQRVAASLRYERSSLSTTFTPAGPPAPGYRKQTLALELSVDWM